MTDIQIKVPPHTKMLIEIACTLNPLLLGDWDDLSEAARDMWKTRMNVSIPCGGEGVAGKWCADCAYGVVLEESEI